MRGRLAALALAALLAAPALGETAPQTVPEPSGYRLEAFRAPTPATLQGARVISTEEARALWEGGGAGFVDVLPQPPKPDLPEGTFWRPPPRENIPGSLWLPGTGYGALSPEAQAYFEAGLARASGDDPSRTVVFYCQAECWMSWNAAKRALDASHEAVAWYPEGTDGWAAAGLPLERREPEPPGPPS